MNRWKKRRGVLAAGLMWAGSGTVLAQMPPAPFPVAAVNTTSSEEKPVEIYYGTQKVAPNVVPAMPAATPESGPVVPASAKNGPDSKEHLRPAEAIVATMHSVRDGARDISSAAVGVLGKVGDRVKHTAESRQIILASYSMPPIPQPQISVSVPPTSQTSSPQIVVVREPSEQRPTVSEAPRGLTLSIEMLVACGIGMFGMLLAGMVMARRGSRKESAMPTVIPPIITSPTSIDCNSIQLMGRYNAGPMRETAEKIEIGPSYHDELQQKKKAEEVNNTAAVEFILNQNLALLAALNPDASRETVHTDAEGFAVPAEMA